MLKKLSPSKEWQPGYTLADVECGVILACLIFCRGNRQVAATTLGISAKTLHTKIKLYREMGIEVTPARNARGVVEDEVP